jgi:hypothetical protein
MFGQGEMQRALVVQDAYLAAVAEHLAECWRLRCPDRAQGERRFLQRPFFARGLEDLKATLLVESPVAFRRCMLFVERDVLDRPRRFPAAGRLLATAWEGRSRISATGPRNARLLGSATLVPAIGPGYSSSSFLKKKYPNGPFRVMVSGFLSMTAKVSPFGVTILPSLTSNFSSIVPSLSENL